MDTHAILITQCLQLDFVKPIGRYDSLPNRLHIGYDESRRLMGENPEDGLVDLTLRWAYRQPEEELIIIHIRDWHDPADPLQQEHFRQFGHHCLADSEGAQFAFTPVDPERTVRVINSPNLSDFVGTNLAAILETWPVDSTRVGLMGVWTGAKILFLAYDIRSRFPEMKIATCSALTASSSRSHHFMALEQLQRLLGVQIFSSVGAFTQFLAGSSTETDLLPHRHAELPRVDMEGDRTLSEADYDLVRYLFRDCQTVHLIPLGGGFSGNLVFSSRSVDIHGHQQVQHVVKLGDQKAIGQERTAFEKVENVLGNSAPRITEFADLKGRGGLKYRYAAMGSGFSTTFKKIYCEGVPQVQLESYLKIVFEDQLARFYQAATLERTNLLEHYRFETSRAPGVRSAVESVLGGPAVGKSLILPGRWICPNPCNFYEEDLAGLLPLANESSYFSYVHGDLNGANIVIDAQDNVWLIDFFHTGRGHVLKDLIKLENDLLYIYTPIESEADIEQAIRLTDILLEIHDLQQPLSDPDEANLTSPAILRAYATVRFIRGFYPPLVKLDRDPLQVFIGQLRYAVHTLSFDESSHYQKLWALYTSGHLSAKISHTLKIRGPLQIDWLNVPQIVSGKLGITILPGRRDLSRTLVDDISRLQAHGVTHILSLVTNEELIRYGVESLFDVYRQTGFSVFHLPILDQGVCTASEMTRAVHWLDQALVTGASTAIHCVGGLGRSGLVAASYLRHMGMDAEDAIVSVRAARSQRALETSAQEDFVRSFGEFD